MENTIEYNSDYMAAALSIAQNNMRARKGGPFGALVVYGDEIVGSGGNLVTSTNDPTAHAEVVAIRRACIELKSFQLSDCAIYSSCEPCPMCLGAIYWARPNIVYYAATRDDAAKAGFDDDFIYQEIQENIFDRTLPMIQKMGVEANIVFEEWKNLSDKIDY